VLDLLTRAAAIGAAIFAGTIGVQDNRPGLVLMALALWLLARRF
jgi:hypothetical protein